MCDPLTIASIALTAGSVVANSVAAGEQSRARDQVLAAERIRQNTLDQEAFALNDQSQQRFVDFTPQQAQKGAQLGDYLSTTVGPDANTAAGSVLPSSESDIVNQERAKQTADAQGFVDQQGNALGDLRAFGDLLGEKSLGQARDAGLIGQVGGFKAGSSNVVPIELNEAAKAGDGWHLLGDLLSGAGGVTSTMALGGANLANLFAPAAAKVGAGAVASSAARAAASPLARGASLFSRTAMLGA